VSGHGHRSRGSAASPAWRPTCGLVSATSPNYVEPFAGSMAVLLGRPAKHAAKIETVNDLDGFIANFWRSVAIDPQATAFYADWPIIEADLNARHAWLVGQREPLLRKLEGDPDYYDPKIAGWWVAGVCGWIGSGYCSGEGPWIVRDGELIDRRQADAAGHLPVDPTTSATRAKGSTGRCRTSAGRGINRGHLGDQPADAAPGRRGPGDQPADAAPGRRGRGIERWFIALAHRLRRVRVTSGGWERVVSPSPSPSATA
jgi:DNA adenine methylase